MLKIDGHLLAAATAVGTAGGGSGSGSAAPPMTYPVDMVAEINRIRADPKSYIPVSYREISMRKDIGVRGVSVADITHRGGLNKHCIGALIMRHTPYLEQKCFLVSD